MLYLEAPFHSFDGVAVFRDHADPMQWYYLPGSPRVATLNGVPQLSLIKFKGQAGTGGFLNVDVDLGLDPDVLDELGRQIQHAENLPDKPHPAPLPVIDGTVSMMLFDAQTPPPPPPGGGGGGGGQPPPAPEPALRFVLALRHPAKPALYGDNRATFSVQLTQEGITVLEQAMRGELSPIGIVYSLDFLGLRPAYHVSVHVDWEVVQKHLEEHEEFGVPIIYSSQIDTFVDSLIEQRIIEIQADTFVVEEDGSPVISRRDEAINDLKDMITDTFFTPTLDPIDHSDDVDTGMRAAGRVLQAIASHGASEVHPFTRREQHATREESKRLDVAMSERTTVKRTIYPQGHLSGLFRFLRDPGVDPTRFVTSVDLDDPWFQRRTVKVVSQAQWAADAITSVNVTLDYGGEVRSLLLTPAQPEGEVSWSSRLAGGGMVRDVDVSYTVHFAGVDGTERPTSLTSGVTRIVGDAHEIDPRELYAISPVPVMALSYPWDRYPQVEVELAYADPARDIRQADVVVLDADATEGTWNQFVRDPQAGAARFRITHRAADQRDQVGEWTDVAGEQVLVRDPFPNGRVLEVVPLLDWTKASRAFVDLQYSDLDHGIVEEASFEFTKDAEATQKFQVRLADVTKREIDYRVTIMNLDGSVVEVPPSTTAQPRITVRADMKGHRVVHLRLPAGTDLVRAKVRDVTVELHYLDADAGLDIADTVTLNAAVPTGRFEYDYVDAAKTAFDYRVTTTYTNNLSRTRDWAHADDTDLAIAVGA